jgi:acylphosphatase
VERLHVFFSGHVQGVGFRYTCHTIAAQFAVTGWVRNLSDGRVEVIAEGEHDELERFVREIEEKMSGYVQSTVKFWEKGTSEFEDFVIKSTL